MSAAWPAASTSSPGRVKRRGNPRDEVIDLPIPLSKQVN
jgi:hypothetical protein